jgi:hypothetical protein
MPSLEAVRALGEVLMGIKSNIYRCVLRLTLTYYALMPPVRLQHQ